MKPASVAALKELREKLTFWSTWRKTKQEWDTALAEWFKVLGSKPYSKEIKPTTLKAIYQEYGATFDYTGAVDAAVARLISDLERNTPETEKQALSAKKEDAIASSKEVRRLLRQCNALHRQPGAANPSSCAALFPRSCRRLTTMAKDKHNLNSHLFTVVEKRFLFY